jgi:hypothetical protein
MSSVTRWKSLASPLIPVLPYPRRSIAHVPLSLTFYTRTTCNYNTHINFIDKDIDLDCAITPIISFLILNSNLIMPNRPNYFLISATAMYVQKAM